MSIIEQITELEPCGIDFKYDDEYISIELEIEKNFNVSNIGEAQWDIIILKCENVLANHSKDLKILSYWLYAQWQLNGWASFFKALETYINILERYNKELFPKVEKRKVKIFEWTENVLEDSLLKAIDSFEKKELILLYDLLERIKKIVPILILSEYDVFKNAHRACGKRIEIIDTKEKEEARQLELQKEEEKRRQEENLALSEAEKLRRKEEEEILSKFSSKESVSHSTQKLPSVDSNQIDVIKSTLLELGNEILKKSPGDFIGYKILFSLGEILLEESFRDTTIITDDFIPSNDVIHATERLEDGNVTPSQLQALIEQLILRPTWIEGYYVISKVLYKLSQKNHAIQVENMLFYFLSKEENILQMKVRDKKMVPENIVTWMETKLLSLNSTDNSAIEYQHTYQEVMKIKKEESSQNALIVLEEHYQKAQGEESRFRWRLLMVDFSLEIGDKKLALSLLYELERLIEKYKIDSWQPSLAIIVYEMLLKPIFTQELSLENKERIYRKLSILDVQKVIKL